MKQKLIILFLVLVSVILLVLTIKGKAGQPIFYQSPAARDTKVGGPFESSGNNSRYVLTEAMVEDQTFFFNRERARFSAPDFVEYNGKFFSIFTPGVSFLGIPFYLLGKSIGFAQLVTFLSTLLLAILNVFLVVRLALKLGTTLYTALLGGFIFLFATNALSYSTSFTQHHAGTTVILLALLNAFGKRTLIKNILLGFIFGAGILVDIPNAFLMSPIILYVLFNHFEIREISKRVGIALKLNIVGLAIGLMPLLVLFGIYNQILTGSALRLGQTIGRTDYRVINQQPNFQANVQEDSDIKLSFPFNPRNQLTGLYALVVSNERGVFFYSPIMAIGILGFVLAYRDKNSKNKGLLITAASVALLNILLYSMFHDPWGGWAFGPRYLIPSAAILSSAIGIAIAKFKRNILFILAFSILSAYSLGVNTVGAMTTTQVPPKVEAVNLPNPIPYTYEYNLQLLDKNMSSSLIYNLFLYDKMTTKMFVYLYVIAVISILLIIYTLIFLQNIKVKND